MISRLPGFVAALAVSMPAVVYACPSCALREGGLGMGWFLVGAMILAPFVTVAIAFPIVRRLVSSSPSLPPQRHPLRELP